MWTKVFLWNKKTIIIVISLFYTGDGKEWFQLESGKVGSKLEIIHLILQFTVEIRFNPTAYNGN